MGLLPFVIFSTRTNFRVSGPKWHKKVARRGLFLPSVYDLPKMEQMPNNTVYANALLEFFELTSLGLKITKYISTHPRYFLNEIGIQQSSLFTYDGLRNRINICFCLIYINNNYSTSSLLMTSVSLAHSHLSLN